MENKELQASGRGIGFWPLACVAALLVGVASGVSIDNHRRNHDHHNTIVFAVLPNGKVNLIPKNLDVIHWYGQNVPDKNDPIPVKFDGNNAYPCAWNKDHSVCTVQYRNMHPEDRDIVYNYKCKVGTGSDTYPCDDPGVGPISATDGIGKDLDLDFQVGWWDAITFGVRGLFGSSSEAHAAVHEGYSSPRMPSPPAGPPPHSLAVICDGNPMAVHLTLDNSENEDDSLTVQPGARLTFENGGAGQFWITSNGSPDISDLCKGSLPSQGSPTTKPYTCIVKQPTAKSFNYTINVQPHACSSALGSSSHTETITVTP